MKTFDEFLTEAKVSTRRRILRTLARQVKRGANAVASSPPAKAVSRYAGYTAAGGAAGIALKLLTGL